MSNPRNPFVETEKLTHVMRLETPLITPTGEEKVVYAICTPSQEDDNRYYVHLWREDQLDKTAECNTFDDFEKLSGDEIEMVVLENTKSPSYSSRNELIIFHNRS